MKNNLNGLLLINKPCGFSSHKIVQMIRKKFSTKAVGHTGTLDPGACGMLPIVIGDATCFSKYLLSESKHYHAIVQLGSQTSTDDSFGESIASCELVDVKIDDIKKALDSFLGYTNQIVPKYSAVHLNGQRLYDLSRNGVDFESPSKTVYLKSYNLINYDHHNYRISLDLDVGSGMYIRSLARDLGLKLGCYAHLYYLRRNYVYPWVDFKMLSVEEACENDLINIDKMLDHMPIINLDAIDAENVAHGRKIFSKTDDELSVVKFNDRLLGVCKNSNGYLVADRLRPFPLPFVKSLF